MKRRFTIVAATLALLAIFIAPLGMMGQTSSIEINTTNSGVTGSYQDKEFDVNDITFKFTQWMKNNNIQAKKNTTNSLYNIDAIPGKITSIVVVQTGTARAITIYGGNSEKPTNQITSPTTAATMTFDFTGVEYNYFSLTTPGNACYFDKITINYDPSGSAPTPTTPCNLALTGAPISLSFDLYNNTTAQVINYTTSSTGTVSVDANNYVNAVVDQQNKTISVTPTAVTGTTQTVTVRQAADATYLAGTATFSVNITDSTPAPTYIFNTSEGLAALNIAVPASNAGTNLEENHNYISGDVTMTITHGTTHTRVWGGTNATDLRVYGGGGSLTFSVPSGQQITRIILVGEKPGNFNEISSKAVHTATWTGTPNRTVTLTADNTCQINTITVVYESNASGIDAPEMTASCNFVDEMEVAISCVTPGVTIYYTTDNTDPRTSNTRTQYSTPFTINATTTVKAVAYLNSNYSVVIEATYTLVYSITLVQATGGTITASAAQAAQGTEITLTATPNVGYSFGSGSWTVTSGSGSVTVTNNKFNMPASNVTVTASFTASNTAYTIYFSVNNKIEMTATVYDGGSIDLTKFVAEGDGYTFEGWSTTAGGENITPQNAYTPSSNITLYPGVNPTPASDDYTLVTSADQLVAGNLVVIAASAYNMAMSTYQKENNRGAHAITKNNSSISWNPGTEYTVCEFVLGGSSSGWSFKDEGWGENGGYLYAAGTATSKKNFLKTEAQLDNDNWGLWTITFGSNNKAIIKSVGNTFTPFLKYNTSSDGMFACYNTDSQSDIVIYTKPASNRIMDNRAVPTTSKITGIDANVKVTVTNIGIVYLTGSNAGNEANLVVEEGGQLVASNNVKGTMLKHINGYSAEKDNYYLISHPFASNANPENVLNMLSNEYDLYYFQQDAVDQVEGEDVLLEWRNYHNNSFNMFVGSGYLYANSDDVDLEFAGTIRKNLDNGNYATYDKNITYKTNSGSDYRFSGWNLVGNPFPSNASVSLPFYKMNSTGDGINGTAVVSGSVIAPMEGVFVIASAATTQVTFTATTSPVTTGAKSSVKIDVNRDNELMDRAIVSFNGCTLSKLNLTEGATKVYFQQGQEEFAIVSVENEGELPVNFKASSNGRYTMSVDVEDLDMNYLHLIDNKTGMDVDLLATPSYTFQASTGDYECRFRLVFDANNENGASTGSEPFAFFNGSEWVVNNNGNATLQVIDMLGRVLSSETINGDTTVNLNQVPGVYMFRLVNGNDVKVQKVVVR